jgi:hypothetical protein
MKAGVRVPLVLLVALALTGCYVVPPLRVSPGIGGGAGNILAQQGRTAPATTDSAAGLAQIRAALVPTALTEADRPVDISAGWTFDWARTTDRARSFRHGPFLEGVWFARRSKAGWRAGPSLHGEIFLPDENLDTGAAYGVGGGVLVETIDYMSGRTFLGSARGEMGLGVAVRGGMRVEPGGTHGYALLSLELRWPGMAGVSIPFAQTR